MNRLASRAAESGAQRSGKKRRSIVSTALVAVLASTLLAGVSAPASAAPPDPPCRGIGVATSIDGTTRNQTPYQLRRTYLEKGVINFFDPEPAAFVNPRTSNDWCALAFAFGTAMKVEYTQTSSTRSKATSQLGGITSVSHPH